MRPTSPAGCWFRAKSPRQCGIKLGDTLTINGVSLPVVAFLGDSEVLSGIVVSDTLFPPDEKDYLAAIYVSGASRAALDAAFADRPDIVVLDRAGLIAEFTEPLDLALGVIYALLAAAVIIAVFGVVNTLALSVLERTREIGVFRAVGATRSLVRRSVRRESVVIAAYGGLLGVGVGLLLGGVMQHVIIGTPILDLTDPHRGRRRRPRRHDRCRRPGRRLARPPSRPHRHPRRHRHRVAGIAIALPAPLSPCRHRYRLAGTALPALHRVVGIASA